MRTILFAVALVISLTTPSLADDGVDIVDDGVDVIEFLHNNYDRVIDIRNPKVKVRVRIDKQIKNYPDLLRDLKAEGRRYVTECRAMANKRWQEVKENLRGGNDMPSCERGYSFRSLIADRYLSIIFDDCYAEGGVHPSKYIRTILWDRKLKRRVSIFAMFKESADNGPTITALSTLVRRALMREFLLEDEKGSQLTPVQLDNLAAADISISNGEKPRRDNIGSISLAPSAEPGKSSGLNFHFSMYDDVAPYETMFVPWTAFKSFLAAKGAAIFAGERPESDVSFIKLRADEPQCELWREDAN